MKNLILLFILLLTSCNTTPIKLSEIEDCIFLTASIFCIDKRIESDAQIDRLKDRARKNTSLSEVEKLEIISYFDNEKAQIIESKSFELDIKYHKFFLGYYLNPPEDRAKIEKEVIDLLNELSQLRRTCKKRRRK